MIRLLSVCAAALVLLAAVALPARAAPAEMENPHPRVRVETSMGNFTIECDRVHAPKTVEAFLTYVREGHYDGMVFYRIAPQFVVQTGSYDKDGHYHAPRHGPIPLETAGGLTNMATTVAMARQEEPNTALAEWFVNLADNGALDPKPGAAPNTTGYAVFGKVVDGMEVVDRMARVKMGGTGPFGADYAPEKPIVIKRVKIV